MLLKRIGVDNIAAGTISLTLRRQPGRIFIMTQAVIALSTRNAGESYRIKLRCVGDERNDFIEQRECLDARSRLVLGLPTDAAH